MQIKVKYIGEDDWGRKLYRNTETSRIYADIDGQLYTTTDDGEPECSLRNDLEIIFVDPCRKLNQAQVNALTQLQQAMEACAAAFPDQDQFNNLMTEANITGDTAEEISGELKSYLEGV